MDEIRVDGMTLDEYRTNIMPLIRSKFNNFNRVGCKKPQRDTISSMLGYHKINSDLETFKIKSKDKKQIFIFDCIVDILNVKKGENDV